MDALLYTQSHQTLLVQADHPQYDGARTTLVAFAELTSRMEPIHVYEIKTTTLWQAASLGFKATDILSFLRTNAIHPIPYKMQRLIVDEMSKWGQLWLQKGTAEQILLRGPSEFLHTIRKFSDIQKRVAEVRPDSLSFPISLRAELKRRLIKHGYPVLDKVGYQAAPYIAIELRPDVRLRHYQVEAIRQFFAKERDGSGVVVLPCGAGKTLVGIGIVATLHLHTLVVTPNESSARQWVSEFIAQTTIATDDVRLYAPGKPLAPITVTTYQMVTAKSRKGEMTHLLAMTSNPWGLVIYDEVHMLPAPLFRLAADLQSVRRLGLTATLVREDGAEGEVFSLIGSKCFEVPWKELEEQGFLASVTCKEIRVPLDDSMRHKYSCATLRERHRLAADNPFKHHVVRNLLNQHPDESILIMGHYVDSLHVLADELNLPILTGNSTQDERARVLEKFRTGKIRCLVLSRIANMAIDLPCASVAIQISGLFGSRQEEAQRLGRLLRPGSSAGVFYTLVSRQTLEERMAAHRQLYLVEQGYAYEVIDASELHTERVTNRAPGRMLKSF